MGARWRVVAASVAGTSHDEVGAPCADACALRVLARAGSEWLVAVASDGAGSAAHGQEGARLACEELLARASQPSAALPSPDELRRWLQAARGRLAEAALVAGTPLRELSCTVLLAVVGEASAVFAQIGDGAIVYRGADGSLALAGWPQTGEYANCTFFLTDDDALERVATRVADGVDELALLTDGLQALALRFDTREAHAPFFDPMFAQLRGASETAAPQLAEELRAFLSSAPVNARTDDDKTLLLATRIPPAGAGTPGGD